jgi:hypothetical protein
MKEQGPARAQQESPARWCREQNEIDAESHRAAFGQASCIDAYAARLPVRSYVWHF